MWDAGRSIKEIASCLNLSTVYHIIREMRKKKKLTKRKPKTVIQRETFLQMHKNGSSDQEIADKLRLKLSSARAHVKRHLLKAKKIKCSTGKHKRKKKWLDLENEKVKKFISMVKNGATLGMLNKRFTISRERARQIINELKEAHGPDFFTAGNIGEK